MTRSERFDAWAHRWIDGWIKPAIGPSIGVGIAAVLCSPLVDHAWGLTTWHAGIIVAAAPWACVGAMALVYGWLKAGERKQ